MTLLLHDKVATRKGRREATTGTSAQQRTTGQQSALETRPEQHLTRLLHEKAASRKRRRDAESPNQRETYETKGIPEGLYTSIYID